MRQGHLKNLWCVKELQPVPILTRICYSTSLYRNCFNKLITIERSRIQKNSSLFMSEQVRLLIGRY